MNKARVYTSNRIKKIRNRISEVDRQKIQNKMNLSIRLYDLMKARNINNTRLAELLNKNNSEVTRWLSGTHNFTTDSLTEIACALNIKLGDLFVSPSRVASRAQITLVTDNSACRVYYREENSKYNPYQFNIIERTHSIDERKITR